MSPRSVSKRSLEVRWSAGFVSFAAMDDPIAFESFLLLRSSCWRLHWTRCPWRPSLKWQAWRDPHLVTLTVGKKRTIYFWGLWWFWRQRRTSCWRRHSFGTIDGWAHLWVSWSVKILGNSVLVSSKLGWRSSEDASRKLSTPWCFGSAEGTRACEILKYVFSACQVYWRLVRAMDDHSLLLWSQTGADVSWWLWSKANWVRMQCKMIAIRVAVWSSSSSVVMCYPFGICQQSSVEAREPNDMRKRRCFWWGIVF